MWFDESNPYDFASSKDPSLQEPPLDYDPAGTQDLAPARLATESYQSMDEGPIVVTGTRFISLDAVNWWDAGAVPDLFWTTHSEGGDGWLGGGVGDNTPPDEGNIDVVIDFERPLTASELEAFDEFLAAIEALTAAIYALADDAEVRLPNGSYISGAALKELWSDTDFIINDDMTYENRTKGGEARMIAGEPTISFNIQYLDRYDNLVGGMNYLVAHDFAHLTQYGTPYFYDQLTANDIARELLASAGLPYLSNPEYGYTGVAPIGFTTPGTVGGDGSGDGRTGGGGGGGGGDYVP